MERFGRIKSYHTGYKNTGKDSKSISTITIDFTATKTTKDDIEEFETEIIE
jgi:hypothetical protein